MKVWPWIGAVAAAGAATLLYGATVEANRLVVERRRLRLQLWPSRLNGYRVALLADLHLRDEGSVALGRRAVEAAISEQPDAICLLGDYIAFWKEDSLDRVADALGPLDDYKGLKFAIAGNHDYYAGEAEWLIPVFEELGIRLLINEVVQADGIAWLGVDSGNEGSPNPYLSMAQLEEQGNIGPVIAMWHEPDMNEHLPEGVALMVSGHSHGGQFTFPWGWTPMHTDNGRIYVRGFYPDAPTPIYVSRGIGVTGPPSRLCCPPEVSILELWSLD